MLVLLVGLVDSTPALGLRLCRRARARNPADGLQSFRDWGAPYPDRWVPIIGPEARWRPPTDPGRPSRPAEGGVAAHWPPEGAGGPSRGPPTAGDVNTSADAFALLVGPRPARLERVLTRSLGPSSIPSLGDGVMLGTAWIDRPVDTQGLRSLLPRPPQRSMEARPCSSQ